MRRMTRRAAVAGLAFASAGLQIFPRMAAAQSPGPTIPLPSSDRDYIEGLLGAGVVGEARPAMPLGLAETYLPPKGALLKYRVSEKGKTSAEVHKLVDTTEALMAPGWHYSIEKEGGVFFQTASDGNLYTVAEEDFGNKVLSRFAPGEPMIISGLKPGESRKSALQVSIYDLSDLTKISHSGSLDVTYTYLGTYRVTVPAGAHDAVLLRWNYVGKVGPARIEDSQYRFLAPGMGMVAMAQVRSISAMLIYNDHTKHGKVLERIQ